MKCRLKMVMTLILSISTPHLLFSQPPVNIEKISAPPCIDGTLRDSIWQHATTFTDFKMLHPEAGKTPSVRTRAYLLYDRSTIYVGIQCLDEDSSLVRAESIDPEDISRDDWAAFCLDSDGDGIGSYYFVVTPRGVKRAGILNFNGDPTATRDLRWSCAARRNAHGFTVTMAIPLTQLWSKSGESVEMAFKVARFISHRGEEDDCPEIRTDQAHVAQFRRIALSGIVPSVTSNDGFVADLWSQYQAKIKRSTQFDYNTFAGRVHGWHGASVLDYLVFPSRELYPSKEPIPFARGVRPDGVTSKLERLEYLPGRIIEDANRFLTRTQTQAFIVIRNDTIAYEMYYNGYARDSLVTSFSAAKSFVSILIGIAIDRGLIRNTGDPITRYLPELAKRDLRFNKITIGDLLHMASGLRYIEDSPPYDNDITYLHPHLREAALDSTAIVDSPGLHWLYNNYNPLLLGVILNRVTGKSITELLQAWLWNPAGMEYGGSWSIDSKDDGFEKMESGINARAIDFAKLGELCLHDGKWRGMQIVSRSWIRSATQPLNDSADFYGDEPFFGAGGHYYGYFWWGSRRPTGLNDFYAVGNKGQYIYCSPQKHVVIVRTGMDFGISSGSWVRLLRQLADQF